MYTDVSRIARLATLKVAGPRLPAEALNQLAVFLGSTTASKDISMVWVLLFALRIFCAALTADHRGEVKLTIWPCEPSC